jgi:CRISPR-associated protein Csm3
MDECKYIELLGKLFVEGYIRTRSGLHIGGASTSLEIGGVSSVVVRDSLTNLPYIPGSSLKGKMRSLLEKFRKKVQNKQVQDVSIHECKRKKDYEECDVCKIFGITPTQESTSEGESQEEPFGKPARIMVRDAILTRESQKELEEAETDLPFTEVKWEAVIDRVTSGAVPRQIERVPAGVTFKFCFGYNVFEDQDKSIFKSVLLALKLIEQDYLGGQGTRGYGQVEFTDLRFFWNSKVDYENGDVDLETKKPIYEAKNVQKALQDFDNVILPKLIESE